MNEENNDFSISKLGFILSLSIALLLIWFNSCNRERIHIDKVSPLARTINYGRLLNLRFSEAGQLGVTFQQRTPKEFFEAESFEQAMRVVFDILKEEDRKTSALADIQKYGDVNWALIMPSEKGVLGRTDRLLFVAPLISPTGLFDSKLFKGKAVLCYLDGRVEMHSIDPRTGRAKFRDGSLLYFDHRMPGAEPGEKVQVLMSESYSSVRPHD